MGYPMFSKIGSAHRGGSTLSQKIDRWCAFASALLQGHELVVGGRRVAAITGLPFEARMFSVLGSAESGRRVPVAGVDADTLASVPSGHNIKRRP